MKVTAGSVWERRGAPDLRLVVDSKLLWRVRFTYTSGRPGMTTTRKLQQQYQQVSA